MSKIYVTNDEGFFQEQELKAAKKPFYGPKITPTREYGQTILGFGAALTEAACICLRRLPEEEQKELLHEIFSPDEMNINIARVCVGPSDYALTPYQFAEVEDDMEMEHFDCSHDDKDIIPVLLEARKANPDLFLFASPWSPPGWMKTSGSIYGGWMLDEYIDAYVTYYIKFLKYYKDKGIDIQALTPQNEAETDQTSKSVACLWTPDQEGEFCIRMRKALDENGMSDMKIWFMDHNFDLFKRCIHALSKQEVRAAVDGIAWHPYDGHPQAIGWVEQAVPGLEHHWTEGEALMQLFGGLNAGIKKEILDMGTFAKSFLLSLEEGLESITFWNLFLDEKGYPNIGPFNCRGSIEITQQGPVVRKTMKYYVLSHLAKSITRGSRRIRLDKKDVPANFTLSAYERPDGKTAIVVANTDHFDSDLAVCVNGETYVVFVRRQSVSTIII